MTMVENAVETTYAYDDDISIESKNFFERIKKKKLNKI